MGHEMSKALLSVWGVHLLATCLQMFGKHSPVPDDLVRWVLGAVTI